MDTKQIIMGLLKCLAYDLKRQLPFKVIAKSHWLEEKAQNLRVKILVVWRRNYDACLFVC